MKRITVFCGSSSGNDPRFHAAAYALGRMLAEKGIGIVYGGAKVGLMGAVADGGLSVGGEVIGVLPSFLRHIEIEHTGLTKLHIVGSMHERKAKMDELSDGVIALPGGFGTLEEFFEMLTWAQLGLHRKPVAILNIGGFYDGLMEVFQKMVDVGLLTRVNQKMVICENTAQEVLEQMENYVAPELPKWITPNKT
jgi:uncharacterized protein (TIGR00730 family)